jgi:hypothetical protein
MVDLDTGGNSTDATSDKEVEMSSNYEWQKQQVREQLNAHHEVAAEHRFSRSGAKKKDSTSRRNLMVLVLITIGLLIVGFQISGCTPAQVASQPPDAANKLALAGDQAEEDKGLSMADRIAFQDRVSGDSPAADTAHSASITMADRIRFQDRVSGVISPSPALTMADRIRFQDRVGK